jgi:hypothetical protein
MLCQSVKLKCPTPITGLQRDITAIDNEKMPDDYDLFLIEDRIMTGDLM